MKNVNLKKYAAAAMAAAMIPAAMAPIVSEAAAPETVEIFENADFQGGSVTLHEYLNGNGLTSYFYWGKEGNLPNDAVSSVKVPEGYKVTLYSDIEGGGETLILTADTSFVGAFNDKASSAKVEKIQDVRLFEDANSKGKSTALPISEENLDKVISFEYWGGELGNDALSSIQIPAGYTVTLYEHYNGTGESVTLDHSSDFLNKLNDEISSIKIEKKQAE